MLVLLFEISHSNPASYLNVYFNDMEINKRLYLLKSLWEIPLCSHLFRKRIDQKKFPFIATNNLIVLAAQWSVKYFFAPNSPIFRKRGGEKKKKRDDYEALCFSSKSNKSFHNRKSSCIVPSKKRLFLSKVHWSKLNAWLFLSKVHWSKLNARSSCSLLIKSV